MEKEPILTPEVVNEEEEKSLEDRESGITLSLPSAYVWLDQRLEQEDRNALCDEIENRVEGLDGVEFNEDRELFVHTKFGEPAFWEQKLPEIKKVIKNFLASKNK